MLRRGLPRVRGGEPWPEGGVAPVAGDADAAVADAAEATVAAGAVVAGAEAAVAGAEAAVAGAASGDAASDAVTASDAAGVPVPGTVPSAAPAQDAKATPTADAVTPEAPVPAGHATARPGTALRRGLPRVSGGEPWPAADVVATGAVLAGVATVGGGVPAAAAASASTDADRAFTPSSAEAASTVAASDASASIASASVPAAASAPAAASVSEASDGIALRRGLPRADGGKPWPPAGVVVSVPAAAQTAPGQASEGIPGSANAPAEVTDVVDEIDVIDDSAGVPVAELVGSAVVQAAGPDISQPLPFRRTVWNGVAPRHDPPADEQPDRKRPTWVQVIAGLFAAAGLGVLAAALIALVRAVLGAPIMQDFLLTYPGEYEPAVHVDPGFAPWIGWQHFFNMFLIILIIRSGLRVRTEKRPTAFWTPKGNSKGKISLTLWLHQALDLLWIINGVIFVVLLFATGHWARIVPTSWEVIPNAISAGLQYVSLDWPHENGWNNYNSLQQLAYFATVFLAAPLAVITGFRMSGLWPKKAERLSKAYPIEWARAVHFPVMLYFVAFIIVHVALVVFTGFLANLGHMYASTEVLGWTGFWVFVASLVVIAAGWWAARPLVIAPIAKLFGQVSAR